MVIAQGIVIVRDIVIARNIVFGMEDSIWIILVCYIRRDMEKKRGHPIG
jgi:hypothetical protein